MYSTIRCSEQKPREDPDSKCENLCIKECEKVSAWMTKLITSITAIAEKNFICVVFTFTYLADLCIFVGTVIKGR